MLRRVDQASRATSRHCLHTSTHKDTSTFANNNSKVNNKHGMKTLLLYIPCSTLHRSRSPRCANMVTSKSTCKSWTTVIGGDKDAVAVALCILLILALVWWQILVCISIFLMHTIFNSIRIRCNGMECTVVPGIEDHGPICEKSTRQWSCSVIRPDFRIF